MNALHRRLCDLLGKLTGSRHAPSERRQYFDENLAAEQWDLLEASALLEVTEFRIFEIAYRRWYGAAPRHYVIEAHFNNYMFNFVVPVWVSHFCRDVVAMAREGTLDPRDFGIYPRQPSRRMMRIGQVYTAMLLAAFLVLVYMAYDDRLFPEREADYETAGHHTMP